MFGRYINDIDGLNNNVDTIKKSIELYLAKNKYKQVNYKNEIVYRKGGKVRAPQFIKIEFNENIIHIEAWISFTLLPNVFAGEFDFKGYSGLYSRFNIVKDVNKIISLIN